MEDKVLWIALQLFLVWLFAMSFCLCICNCLFIRSDRRKSTASKLAAAQVALERQKRLSKQYVECDEENLVGSGVVGGKENPMGQRYPDSLSPTRQPQPERQLTDQVSPGFTAHSAYIQRATNPTFIFQHPSADDVNPSPLASQQPIDIDRKPDLLFREEKRFSGAETATNPDVSGERSPVPSTMMKIPTAGEELPGTGRTTRGNESSFSSSNNSNSSIGSPQTPIFTTEVEGLDRGSRLSGNRSAEDQKT